MAELAQQLAATQAQVAALSSQLTTLAHRITYDLERGAQTTSERVLRELAKLSHDVTDSVGKALGPAIDDLTDQVEADRERMTRVLEEDRDRVAALLQEDLASRIAVVGEAVDALPLGNVELISSIEALGADLQDRFTRFSTRLSDQVQAIESSTTAELARLRDHLEEVRTAVAQPSADRDTVERMAGQVERLAGRPAIASEVIEAMEHVIDEHLEVIRDNLDARVGALAPALHDELEAVRAEALAGIVTTEETLVAQVEALEVSLTERVEAALGDQIDALDGVVTARHEELLASLSTSDEERLEQLEAAIGITGERVDEVLTTLSELQRATPDEPDDGALASIAEELQSLRRRIKVRFETGDGGGGGLSDEQLAELAKQVAAHLR